MFYDIFEELLQTKEKNTLNKIKQLPHSKPVTSYL